MNSIPGLSAEKPDAAFYIFPKIDLEMYNISNDQEFVLELLREEKILLTSSTGFNWDKPDHFRLVYLARVEILEEAVCRLERFLNRYRR